MTINRDHTASRSLTYIFRWKGKLREVSEALSMRAVDVLLINGELKPSQHYLLESELKVECMDRIRLVLKIFDDRAYSREARLQVQRARLRYEIPFSGMDHTMPEAASILDF